MDVVSHPAMGRVAQNLATVLDGDVVTPLVDRFPDGEPRVTDATPGDVLVADMTTPTRFLESLIILDAMREGGAKPVVAVPYLLMARQDQAFNPGEPISVRVILESLGQAAGGLVVLDPHKPAVLEMAGVPHVPATAVPELVDAFSELGADLVLAPDKGASQRAEEAAQLLECDVDFLEKVRLGPDEVEHRTQSVDVEGRTVVIVDDIISTGGTMASATQVLLDQGANEVHVAATHGVFVNQAMTRLTNAGVKSIIVTDSRGVPGDAAVRTVSAGPGLARGVQALASR